MTLQRALEIQAEEIAVIIEKRASLVSADGDCTEEEAKERIKKLLIK